MEKDVSVSPGTCKGRNECELLFLLFLSTLFLNSLFSLPDMVVPKSATLFLIFLLRQNSGSHESSGYPANFPSEIHIYIHTHICIYVYLTKEC